MTDYDLHIRFRAEGLHVADAPEGEPVEVSLAEKFAAIEKEWPHSIELMQRVFGLTGLAGEIQVTAVTLEYD